MDALANNWPIIIAAIAAAVLAYGLIKKLAKLAFVLVCVAAIIFGVVTQLAI